MRPTRRFSLHGVLAILLVGIPAGATLAATLAGPHAQPMSGLSDRPGLAFYQYLVDLGAVRPSEEVTARFAFANTGTEPITIQEIVPSCGCLKPTLRRKTFAPGKSGDFLARIRTAGETAGLHEYTLVVKYTDPQPREELLTFRVRLPDNQVSIEPKALLAYQLNGSSTTSEVLIRDRREQPLELLNVVTSSSLIRAELGPKSLDESGHPQYKVLVTMAGKIPGRVFNGLVTVFTNDPTYRTLKVPVRIHGPGTPVTKKNDERTGETRLR